MPGFLNIEGLKFFKDKQDIVNEEKFLQKTEFDTLIGEKISSVYRYKGTKPSFEDLPQENNEIGDVWDVDNGMNYAWDGSNWDALGGIPQPISLLDIDTLFEEDSE